METDRAAIEVAVTDIVRKLLGLPDEQAVRPEADFKTDLGTDSLTDAELGMEIEDRFEIEVPDGVRPRNIREIVDLILAAKAKAKNEACRR
jgi:acyl carrier protein